MPDRDYIGGSSYMGSYPVNLSAQFNNVYIFYSLWWMDVNVIRMNDDIFHLFGET